MMNSANDNGGTTAGNDFEPDAQLSEFTRVAREEPMSKGLETRVLASLAYRTHAERQFAAPRRTLPVKLLFGGAALAAAAAAFVVLRSAEEVPDLTGENMEIAAEPVASDTAPVGAPSSTALVPPTTPSTDALRAPAFNPCIGAAVADGSAPLIDDFEDGDDAVLAAEGRVGLWRWARDTDAPGTAPALLPVPRPGATASNRLGLHAKGDRLREWGATMEFVFDQKCYDASAYTGIAFEARGAGRIYLAPREVSVIPIAEGGRCEKDCHNSHVAKVELEPQWKNYEVRFSEVEQRGYDTPALNPKRLHSLAFLIRPEDTPYDVWLDNVRFLTD